MSMPPNESVALRNRPRRHQNILPRAPHAAPCPLVSCRLPQGIVGGHALAGGSRPGSYQVTSATPRIRRRRTKQRTVSPVRATDALRATPPSTPRLPDRNQASRRGRVTLTKRLSDARLHVCDHGLLQAVAHVPFPPAPPSCAATASRSSFGRPAHANRIARCSQSLAS